MIDRPIKPLVDELNRIGLKTKFSCCGFTYRDEEEEKGHTKYAYIIFYLTNKKAFFKLAELCSQNTWRLIKEGNNEWMLYFRPWEGNFERGSKHYYEYYIIAIDNLLQKLKKIASNPVKFENGNNTYHKKSEYLDNEWIKEEQF